MCTTFWDHHDVIYTEDLHTDRKEGHTMTKEEYIETLYIIHKTIKRKCPVLLSSWVIILHDNARAHTVRITLAFLADFGWIIFTHLSFSPDLAPSDYYQFTQWFTSDADLETKVKTWFQKQDPSFYTRGIYFLVSYHYKCMNVHSDYVEK